MPLAGDVTAKVKPVATIASNALPPCFKISIPTSDARREVEDMAPFVLLAVSLLQLVKSTMMPVSYTHLTLPTKA